MTTYLLTIYYVDNFNVRCGHSFQYVDKIDDDYIKTKISELYQIKGTVVNHLWGYVIFEFKNGKRTYNDKRIQLL
jgi:hypothetical protein